MREIPLTKGYVALVDDDDYERCAQFKWTASVRLRRDGRLKTVYAERRNSDRKVEYLHRLLLEISDPTVHVDHVDHDGLNCQKRNLRKATASKNGANKRSACASGYRGVYWHRGTQKWRAMLTVDTKQIHVGLFSNIEDAAKAYDSAASKHFGEFAILNFKSEERCQ